MKRLLSGAYINAYACEQRSPVNSIVNSLHPFLFVTVSDTHIHVNCHCNSHFASSPKVSSNCVVTWLSGEPIPLLSRNQWFTIHRPSHKI
jgi:hypothetical protein